MQFQPINMITVCIIVFQVKSKVQSSDYSDHRKQKRKNNAFYQFQFSIINQLSINLIINYQFFNYRFKRNYYNSVKQLNFHLCLQKNYNRSGQITIFNNHTWQNTWSSSIDQYLVVPIDYSYLIHHPYQAIQKKFQLT